MVDETGKNLRYYRLFIDNILDTLEVGALEVTDGGVIVGVIITHQNVSPLGIKVTNTFEGKTKNEIDARSDEDHIVRGED